MIRRRPTCRRVAVSLLEIILSIGLLVSLTSMTYWFYFSSLSTRKDGTAEAHKLRLARVVLDRIATEIRQVGTVTNDYGAGLRGDKEQIWLTTRRVPATDASRVRFPGYERPAEYDIAQVEYRIARHPEILHDDGWELPLGLARIEKRVARPLAARLSDAEQEQEQDPTSGEQNGEGEDPTVEQEGEGEAAPADPAAGVPPGGFFDTLRSQEEAEAEETGAPGLGPKIDWEEMYAPEIHFLRFCYYDGYGWWDTWQVGGENPLPQLVMVTIGYDDRPACGRDFGDDEYNEEFCECLNRDPPDCEPLENDQYSTVVRLPPADPLFRSRVTRETQGILEEGAEEAAEGEGGMLP